MSGPGPFGSEDEAREWVRLVLAPAAYADSISEGNGALLERAIQGAGLTLGTYDVRILRWLAGYETATCAVVAALIWRAGDTLPPGWAPTIRQALADAIRFRKARGATVDADQAGLYRTLAQRYRLDVPEVAGDIVLLGTEDLRTVLDALDVAADAKRDRVADCPDCEAHPAELCGTCEWRLETVGQYDALAARLRGERR